jgi:hypothetical protein
MHCGRFLLVPFLGILLSTKFEANSRPLIQDSLFGTVHGQVTVAATNGTKLIPDSATVNLIYEGGSLKLESSTAGDAYLTGATKVARSIAKRTSRDQEKIAQEPKEQRIDEFEKYELQAVDEGLNAAVAWSIQHNCAWQLAAVRATAEGFWSEENVRPGHYKIVARGKVGDLDTEWETEIDVRPGQTISVPLTHSKVGRRFKS